MRKWYKIFLAIVAFLSLTSGARAASAEEEVSSRKREEFLIHYRFDKINVDSTYLDNKKSLAQIRYFLRNSHRVDSITIYAWASPEGGYPHNKWLAQKRAESAKRLLLSLAGENGSLSADKILISPLAENWEGLTRMVEQNYTRSNRAALLKILYADGIGEETRKWRIKHLDNGVTWNYLKRNYMKRLRAATWVCVWADDFLIVPISAPEDTLLAPVPTISREVYKPLQQETPDSLGEKLVLEIKTNLLYDAVTALNIGVEVPIGEHFSVGAYYLNPWWAWGPNDKKYAFQIQELGFEGRWYPSLVDDRRLTGWYAGLYAKSAQYDFQNDKKYCYQGEYWSVGATAGYVFHIKKYMRLELGLQVGYLQSDYRHYQPDAAYEHLYRDPDKVGRYYLFGPTSVSATLTVPLYVKYKK